MKRRPHIGIVDLGIAAVIAVLLALPPRPMYASAVVTGDSGEQFALALAEARTVVAPEDAAATAELSRRLAEAGQKDWAIDEAVRGSERAKGSPTVWRALLAASSAFVDRLDVVPALDYANRALAACRQSRQTGAANSCPSWEEIRVALYQQSLDAGVRSGIDPRRDPKGFRRAQDRGMLQIHLKAPRNSDRR